MRELLAAIATAAAHLLTNRFGGHGVFVVAAVLGWTGYCVLRSRREPAAPTEWGLRWGNSAAAWKTSLIPGAAAAVAFAAWGKIHGTLYLPLHGAVLLALYPLWGLVQQLLVQAFVVRHVDATLGPRRRALTVLIGASGFGVVHLQHPELAAATFAFGLFATWFWLRYRNLWPLAFWHGTLGVLFYYWVLGRDPWIENFG